MSKQRQKPIPVATAVEVIEPDPHNVVKLEEEPDQFEMLAQAAAAPAEAVQKAYLEEKTKLQSIKDKAAALAAELRSIKRSNEDYLRKVGKLIDQMPSLQRAGALGNLVTDVLNLYKAITESLAAMIHQAEDVPSALDALGPRDLEPAHRGRAVWVASFYGTTGIESGPDSIRQKIGQLKNAVDRLERFMANKPKATVSIRIVPVSRHSLEPTLPEAEPRQQIAE